MERRRFLATVASATGLTLAGCTGSPGGPADGDESPGGSTDTTVPGDTATESPTASPTGSRETDTLSGSPPGNGTESPDEPPMNDTETGTIDGIDYSLDVLSTVCRSDEADEASVVFDSGDGKVVVSGAITTSDLGEVATVSDLAYDDGSGHLAVTIGRRTQDDDGVSGQCLAIASYEARFRYPEQLPDRVTVTHEGQAGTTEVVSATSDGDY